MRKRNFSLGLRTARNLILLAGVLALGAVLPRVPQWQTEGQLRAEMRSNGLTGQGELLWRGQVPFYMGTSAYMVVQEEDGQIYASRLESYEGRPHVSVSRCEALEGPTVTLTWDSMTTSGDSQLLFQAMALRLPAEAQTGRLTVEWGSEDARTVDGQRDRGIIMFPFQRLNGEQISDGASYTLTLWNGAGAVVGQASGALDSLWR